jgi:hypothetical protein
MRPNLVVFLLCAFAAAAPADAQAPPATPFAQDYLRFAAAKIDWSDQEAAAKHRRI